jgi:hypothetical protein
MLADAALATATAALRWRCGRNWLIPDGGKRAVSPNLAASPETEELACHALPDY